MTKQSKKPRLYQFAIYRIKKDSLSDKTEIRSICIKDSASSKFDAKLKVLSNNSDVTILETGEIVTFSIEEEIRKHIERHRNKEFAAPITHGSIIEYTDEGVHTALVLHRGRKKSFLLFATTNPEWNPRSRPITKDEQMLLGYPLRSRKTYFAPVIRDNEFMRATEKTFPTHRIEELKQEFEVKSELLGSADE